MQRGHYVRSISPTGIKARASRHAVNHLDPNLLSRGNTFVLLIDLLVNISGNMRSLAF